jgi:hypothetical protein
MSYRDTAELEHAARSAMVYSLSASNELEERRRTLLLALLPAVAILLAAGVVLARLLSA